MTSETSPRCYRYHRLAALLACLVLLSCLMEEFDFDGRPCPCVDQWTCDESSNRCIRTGSDSKACDWSLPFHFDHVEEVYSLNSDSSEHNITLSPDGLTIYFVSSMELYQANRSTLEDEFDEPRRLGSEVNSGDGEGRFSVTPDGLTAYLASRRPAGGDAAGANIWRFDRGSMYEPFRDARLVEALSSPLDDNDPVLSPDGLQVLLARNNDEYDQDIFVASRSSLETEFDQPAIVVPGLSSEGSDSDPSISADGQVIVFSSSRPGGMGDKDIWYARWDGESYQAHPLPGSVELNTSRDEGEVFIRSDGCELFFAAERGGTGERDIYRALFVEDE